MHQYQTAAAEARGIRLDHRQGEGAGDRGIAGIATGAQDIATSRGQRGAGHHRPPLVATFEMQTGIEPFVQVIAGVTPPARGPRGAVSNQTRSTVYQTALHNARIAMHGGGA